MIALRVRVGEGFHHPARIGDLHAPGHRQLGGAKGLVELDVLADLLAVGRFLDLLQRGQGLGIAAGEHVVLRHLQIGRLAFVENRVDLVGGYLFDQGAAGALAELDLGRIHADNVAVQRAFAHLDGVERLAGAADRATERQRQDQATLIHDSLLIVDFKEEMSQ